MVPPFCPAWMGNLGRPPEEVGRRKKGAERAKAWKLAQGPERGGCGGLARRGWQCGGGGVGGN